MSDGWRADEGTRERGRTSPSRTRPRRRGAGAGDRGGRDGSMLLGGRRLLVYGLVVVAILVGALPRAARSSPGSRTRCARSRMPTPSGWRSRSGSTCCRSPPTSLCSAASSAARACRRAVRERLDWRTSYQITLAGLAATRLFSAGGAGGIALTYWALRRAGMGAREAGQPDGRVPRAALHGLPRRAGGLRHLPADRPVPGAEPGRDDDRAGGAGGRRTRSSCS